MYNMHRTHSDSHDPLNPYSHSRLYIHPTEPWDYPLFILVGSWVGVKYVQVEEAMLERVNEKRAALDKPAVALGNVMDLKKWGAE